MRTHTRIIEPMSHLLTRTAPLVLALSLGCGAEQPAPAPTPKPAVQPPAPAPEPAVQPPAPEKPPPPAAIAVPEGCKVVIVGQDGDAQVKRALINTQNGGLYDTTVEDGQVIQFDCPPEAEREGANIIAEKTNDELVHWSDVNIDPKAADGQALDAADAKPDLPEGLDEETLARLQAKWPDLSKWEEEAETGDEEVASADDGGAKTPPPANDKIPVSFSAHKLYWAELKLENVKTKKLARLILDPKGRKSLPPGTYSLSVKLEAEGQWQDAGSLEIEAGKQSYSVQMLDGPPRPKVTSK